MTYDKYSSMNDKTIYSDFDVTFRRHAVTGDVVKKTNAEDIRQSLFLLLKTNFYERKWHPEIGSYLNRLLFNQDDDYIKDIMKDQIKNLIDSYEPRIVVSDIRVGYASIEDEARGRITIKIYYTIKIINYRDEYTYTITRVR